MRSSVTRACAVGFILVGSLLGTVPASAIGVGSSGGAAGSVGHSGSTGVSGAAGGSGSVVVGTGNGTGATASSPVVGTDTNGVIGGTGNGVATPARVRNSSSVADSVRSPVDESTSPMDSINGSAQSVGN